MQEMSRETSAAQIACWLGAGTPSLPKPCALVTKTAGVRPVLTNPSGTNGREGAAIAMFRSYVSRIMVFVAPKRPHFGPNRLLVIETAPNGTKLAVHAGVVTLVAAKKKVSHDR